MPFDIRQLGFTNLLPLLTASVNYRLILAEKATQKSYTYQPLCQEKILRDNTLI